MSLGWIDVLRHVLSLAVIFQHMPAANRYPPAVNRFIKDMVPAVDGAVLGFFMLAGLFAKPEVTGSRIRRRAVRLLVPYLLFSAIYSVAAAVRGARSASDARRRAVAGFDAAPGIDVAPQLYFLPYLFLISTVVDVPMAKGRRAALGVLALLFVAYRRTETSELSKAHPRLLALYGLAYAIGAYRGRYAGRVETVALNAAALLCVRRVSWRSRHFDLAVVVLLVEAAVQLSKRRPLSRRLPGSGGVYLLHTPILNYAISVGLAKLGVARTANVFTALTLTYVAGVGITLAFRRVRPAWGWLLLEQSAERQDPRSNRLRSVTSWQGQLERPEDEKLARIRSFSAAWPEMISNAAAA